MEDTKKGHELLTHGLVRNVLIIWSFPRYGRPRANAQKKSEAQQALVTVQAQNVSSRCSDHRMNVTFFFKDEGKIYQREWKVNDKVGFITVIDGEMHIC